MTDYNNYNYVVAMNNNFYIIKAISHLHDGGIDVIVVMSSSLDLSDTILVGAHFTVAWSIVTSPPSRHHSGGATNK